MHDCPTMINDPLARFFCGIENVCLKMIYVRAYFETGIECLHLLIVVDLLVSTVRDNVHV